MNEIVVVGDVHEGRAYDIKPDVLTGVSARTMDLHNNLVQATRYAVDNKAALFVLLGDVFDRTNVQPIFRELVRRDVIEPLGQANVKVLILAGNHDQPRVFERGTSIDDLSGYPHVRIFRKPNCVTENVASKKICFILMPFLYPDTILDQSGKIVQEVPEDQRITVSQEILKEFLRTSAKTDSDARILLAHYYFEGAEVSNAKYPEAEMGELEFTPSMLPSNIDLAIFGHIHLHQTREARGVPVVFVGALERIDWGEKRGPKGFVTLDTASMRWKFHELPTREMLEVNVKLGENDKDPTATILDKIPPDVEGKMVRIFIEHPLGMRTLVREDRLGDKLGRAFDFRFLWKTPEPQRIGQPDTDKGLPDHFSLLESFIDRTFAKHPHKDLLVKEGRNILKETLQE